MSIRSGKTIEFLVAFNRQTKKPLLIIRGGADIHGGRKLNAWLEDLNNHTAVAHSPAYTSELNAFGASSVASGGLGHGAVIGRCLDAKLGADNAVVAGPVFDDELLARGARSVSFCVPLNAMKSTLPPAWR